MTDTYKTTGEQNSGKHNPIYVWLNKHFTIILELRLKFIKVIPKSRLGRVIVILLGVLIVCGGIYTFVFPNWKKEFRHKPSIAVFVPDEKRVLEGAFYQDGVVQRKGFESALLDAEQLPNKLEVSFYDMKRDDTPNQLLIEMKALYIKQGATYFIMTMSGKVIGLREHFKNWHAECVKQGKREPILIATVASAPNIADASNGILRWYVRSEEESSIIAAYLRWKMAIERAAVFFIDDAYGNKGMEVFRNRFKFSLGGLSIEPFPMNTGDAKREVKRFLDNYHNNTDHNIDRTGVFVVGYGEMVRETLNELVAQGFEGPIGCASTLTEPDWQPNNLIADNRIVTVLPRLLDPQAKLCGNDRNIVYFFAKETLHRVLALTANDSDSRTFIERWKRDDNIKSRLEQECLANGDIIVQLDVAGADQWR
jgi:hypothetical protein